MITRRRVALVVVLALALGCASVPPPSQDFLQLETSRFELLSALGRDETARLAMDLESFEAAVDFVLGQPFDPAREGRTLVLAFDDRGPARSFAVRDETAYWLPTLERPMLVFRTPGGWDRRANRELLHRYAHRVIRARAGERLPPWLEEGLAQLIGSLERHGDEIRIGAPVPEFVRVIRDWRRTSFDSVLRRSWSADETAGARLEWSAVCWAIAHLEWSASVARRAALREALVSPASTVGTSASAARAIPSRNASALAEEIHEHIALERFRVDRVRAMGDTPDLDRLRPIARAESQTVLGELALRLGHRSVARRAFERAIEERPDDGLVLVGLARTLDEASDRAVRLLGRAEVLGPNDPRVALRLGAHALERARRAADEAERRRLALRSRHHYQSVRAADPSHVAALVGLASAEIIIGDDLAVAETALERAAALRPGSLGVDLGRARLAARRGRIRHAELIILDVLSRTHEPSLIGEARALLEADAHSDARARALLTRPRPRTPTR